MGFVGPLPNGHENGLLMGGLLPNHHDIQVMGPMIFQVTRQLSWRHGMTSKAACRT